MASSIIGGLIAKGYPENLICASDPNEDQLTLLGNASNINTTTDNRSAIANADIIILAVKPQVTEQVLVPLSDIVQQNRPLIISIAAGITVANLLSWLGPELPVVRTMPNTPALVKMGATGLYANQQVSAVQKRSAQLIFNSVGVARWFENETDLDVVVALSGSGPAYYFMVMEAMETAAIQLGLSADAARQLTLQTALGSAQLALQSEDAPAELRRKVTSPGGTTEAAINCFQEDGLKDLFARAMKAAYDRSIELAG